MAIRSLLLAHVLVLCALVAGQAGARQEGKRIVVVTDRADSATLPLLRGELGQLGLEVIEVESSVSELSSTDLTETARQHHAVAAVRVRISGHTVEVWTVDRATGDVSLREVFTQGVKSSVEARLVVLQAVELLRWSLKDVEPPPKAQRESRMTSSEKLAPMSVHQEGRLFLGVAPFALLSPGGASSSAGAQFDLAFRWSWVATRFAYAQSLLPASMDSLGSQAELSTRWLSIQALFMSSALSSRVRPSLGIGAALLSTRLHGIAAAPRTASNDRLFSVAPILDARLSCAVIQQMRIFAGISVLVPMRSDNVVFQGKSVGTYGALFVAPGAGVEVIIP